MIDKGVYVAEINNLLKYRDERDNLIIGNITLIPIPCPKTGEIVKHQSFQNNLLFTVRGNVLIISNSLHKFHKGNNYSDFSFSELLTAIKKIENITGVKAENFKVKKLEFALNIKTVKPPHQYLPMFSDYKGKEYDKMKSKTGFWYGNKYKLSEYALKIYDKSEMIKRTEAINLNQNILRFETEYSKARKIPSIHYLADLKNKDKIKVLFNELVSQIQKLNCTGEEDFSKVNSRDREMYFAGQNPLFWDVEKSINKETSKKKKQRYRKIQSQVSYRNLINDFVQNIEEKFNHLIQT